MNCTGVSARGRMLYLVGPNLSLVVRGDIALRSDSSNDR